MDEEITIIDSNTRNEKIKNFFIDNKKNLVVGFSIIFIVIISYFSIKEMKERNKIKLANQFNLVTINFKTEDKQTTIDQLNKLINENDTTYSPLALYFLIDNDLIDNKNELNSLFDELNSAFITSLDRKSFLIVVFLSFCSFLLFILSSVQKPVFLSSEHEAVNISIIIIFVRILFTYISN